MRLRKWKRWQREYDDERGSPIRDFRGWQTTISTRRVTAFEAAQYLKSLNPHVEVAVLDLQTNFSTPVIWKSEASPVPMKRK
jgi:hypothetical protein